MSRITKRFAELRAQSRAAFVPFITAGDPDAATTEQILKGFAAAGADLIELGMPFSDPMADGPSIQASSLRALKAGMTLTKTLEIVRRFRSHDAQTPLVLMGYYNPIHAYGTARFARDAGDAGVDGLITVDLPPEEDEVLRLPAGAHGIDLIHLVTPTSDDARLATILAKASGYLYYVSIAGVTGTKSFDVADVQAALARLQAQTQLPCTVGFGIRTPEQAAEIGRFADGAVVGTAIVERIAQLAEQGASRDIIVRQVLEFCALLAKSVHAARPATVLE